MVFRSTKNLQPEELLEKARSGFVDVVRVEESERFAVVRHWSAPSRTILVENLPQEDIKELSKISSQLSSE